ncbi:hypothetical protein MLD38_030581 [Melastoma candidum]|uniref:Uncharacterized protein n=1 Tax=Melastoma candidum TaxID=119954 RepID=A0ACB9MM66_9MYRT|nr:hypothetical protein MLD38_030581 [Melastoma candidum]
MEAEEGGRVRELIEKATDTTDPGVDPRLLKAIKAEVRYSDPELRLAAQTLMSLMKRNHSQVRYISLLIIDELFMRSKLFRDLIVENLDQLLILSIGFRRNMPLPAPKAVASRLHSTAIEFLEKWSTTFGVHYRKLRLGFDYCKNNLRLQFPDVQGNAARVRQERREREMRTREILLRKFEGLKANFSTMKEEVRSTVNEIEECLTIARAKEEAEVQPLPNDEDLADFQSRELLQLRLASLKEGKRVHENTENKVIFDALRESYRLLVSKHLASVQEWIAVAVRVDLTDNHLRNSIMKELIDIQNNIRMVKKNCEEIVPSLESSAGHIDDEEEDIWEVGKIEAVDRASVASREQAEEPSIPSMSGVKDDPTPPNIEKSSINGTLIESADVKDSLRDKLLAEAPVVNWGPHLNSWGSTSDVLANHRGLELESHWGRVDYDAVIPAQKIAELNVQATLYKEERVTSKPCNAPLKNGGLCQRRDLRVCPFHGTIVPRDSCGNPIYPESMEIDQSRPPEIDLVKQLAEQAVKNVRTHDHEELERRINDKKLLKRAKLARVREHNEAVLREAALASTSASAAVGADPDISISERVSARNKKETLASMLRKKETAKDRLGQRLLNARATEASVSQLTSDADACYREAFPNQW